MISNLMPFDWMTRLKLLWLRLILSLNCSLNSGLLLFFTVLVLSLWASSYTRKRMHQNTNPDNPPQTLHCAEALPRWEKETQTSR